MWSGLASAALLGAPRLAQADPAAVARFPDLPAAAPTDAPPTLHAPLTRPPTAVHTEPRPAPALAAGSWATREARHWFERAEAHERRKNFAQALDAYTQAVRADATFGPAYLGLGRLRERLDDWREAERVYDRAVRLPEVAAEALARRAHLRRQTGRAREAFLDLEAAVEASPETPSHLETLARWYVEDRNWTAALATCRRLEGVLSAAGDTSRAGSTHTQVQALMMLADATDPVRAGREHPDWVRRSLAAIADR